MKTLFKRYDEATSSLEKEFHKQFTEAIKAELDLLDKGEVVPMHSPDCEFDSIPTGTYTDAFNQLQSDGMVPKVYNHLSCGGDGFACDEPVSIFSYSVPVLKEALDCLIKHNKNKRMTADDMENLNTLLSHLDGGSELAISLEKGMKLLK